MSTLRFNTWQNTGGTEVANSTLGTGKILQVVFTTTTTETSTSSTSYVDTACAATITPTSSSNKVLVIVTTANLSTSNNNASANLTIYRGDVATGTDLGSDAMAIAWNATSIVLSPAAMMYLDSPGTTSAITYTQALRSNNSPNTVYAKSQQSMILMEVLA